MDRFFFFPFFPAFIGGIVVVFLIAWTLVWKGMALWKAARRGEMWWFVALLLINTVGLLEIAYIYYFSERKKKKEV